MKVRPMGGHHAINMVMVYNTVTDAGTVSERVSFAKDIDAVRRNITLLDDRLQPGTQAATNPYSSRPKIITKERVSVGASDGKPIAMS